MQPMSIIDVTPSDIRAMASEGETYDAKNERAENAFGVFDADRVEPLLSRKTVGGPGDLLSFVPEKNVADGSEGHDLVFKPVSSSSSSSLSPKRGGSGRTKHHPWGPEAQGLPEVETLAGDTATMTTSEQSKRSRANGYFLRSGGGGSTSKKSQSQRSASSRGMLAKSLRLEDEELEEDFSSAKIRQGIETARRRGKVGGPSMSSWKTPYEVDAPRAIMLPRDHPQESSTDSSSRGGRGAESTSSPIDPITVEQKIWKGIEALMADTFSSDDDTASLATADVLPKALVRAMSTRSFLSAVGPLDGTINTNNSRDDSQTISEELMVQYSDGIAEEVEDGEEVDQSSEEDELKMAQAALSKFMDFIVPDDSSLPTLATINTNSSTAAESYDEIALAEVALHNFMDVLLQEVDTVSASFDGDKNLNAGSSRVLSLLDLFQWTLRMNVDGDERLRFLEAERERQTLREKELEEEIKKHEEKLRLQKEAELEAQRQAEADRILQEQIREMEKEKEELSRRSRRSIKKKKSSKNSKAAPPAMDTLDGAALEERLLKTAERLRLEAEGEPDESHNYTPYAQVGQPPFVELEGGSGALSAPSAYGLSQHSKHLPRDMSSNSIPDLSSDDGSKRSKLPPDASSRWATIGGLPIVMPGDEASLDPASLHSLKDRAARANASSSEIVRRQAKEQSTHSENSARSMPSLLPSHSKRLLYVSKDDATATSLLSEDLSIDPADLPNLAETRVARKAAVRAANEAAELSPTTSTSSRSHKKSPSPPAPPLQTEEPATSEQISPVVGTPAWFGGRPVIMETGSTASDDNSPPSIGTNMLPSSFHEGDGEDIQVTMSESGSTNPSITKLSSKRNKPSSPGRRPSPRNVPRPDEELPELKSISDGSSSSSSGSSSSASSSSTSTSAESTQSSEMERIFTNSFMGQKHLESPNSSQAGISATERFFTDDKSALSVVKGDLPMFNDIKSDPLSFDMKGFDSDSTGMFGDFEPVESSGAQQTTTRSNSKTTISTKTPIDDRPAEEMEELTRYKVAAAIMAASQAKSVSVPSDRPVDKLQKQNSNHTGTDVASVGSAGDLHIMGSWVRFNSEDLARPDDHDFGEDERSAADDITLDSQLVRDAMRWGDMREVPAVNRRYHQASFGTRIRSSLKQMKDQCSSNCRRSPRSNRVTLVSSKPRPRLQKKLSSRRCLLHDEDGGYDRTPIDGSGIIDS